MSNLSALKSIIACMLAVLIICTIFALYHAEKHFTEALDISANQQEFWISGSEIDLHNALAVSNAERFILSMALRTSFMRCIVILKISPIPFIPIVYVLFILLSGIYCFIVIIKKIRLSVLALSLGGNSPPEVAV